MLYRHERETPKKRGVELLKDSRMCKVHGIYVFLIFHEAFLLKTEKIWERNSNIKTSKFKNSLSNKVGKHN